MYENIIGQPITYRLQQDIITNTFPPSILFTGPAESGKGTAALETARTLCCDKTNALWKCECNSCFYHRNLSSPDLLILGPRHFSQEISAAQNAFLKNTSLDSTKMFFFRAVRKFLMRFSPILWSDDPKISKINRQLEIINDLIDEFQSSIKAAGNTAEDDNTKISKLTGKILNESLKLESEYIAESIPAAHIRNSSAWLHLAPAGKKKVLIIENADKMQDAARNSLLKILEEPPDTSNIILTSKKPEGLLPTILSRLRQYRFIQRKTEHELEIIRRVFREEQFTGAQLQKNDKSLISLYLDEFLSVSEDALYSAACFFWLVLADMQKKEDFKSLSKYFMPIADKSGFDLNIRSSKDLCSSIMEKTGKFEARGVFSKYLEMLCITLKEAVDVRKNTNNFIMLNEILIKHSENARIAVEIYKQQTAVVLERFCYELVQDLNRYE
ncbi:hypothetical protein AGMMS50212_14120 [Spirochaetia bacterium]|nr:hypothetical protein AGMMS50212_14120 [Spirochaetia bacterium]